MIWLPNFWNVQNCLKMCSPKAKRDQWYVSWYHHWYLWWDPEPLFSDFFTDVSSNIGATNLIMVLWLPRNHWHTQISSKWLFYEKNTFSHLFIYFNPSCLVDELFHRQTFFLMIIAKLSYRQKDILSSITNMSNTEHLAIVDVFL